MPQTLVERKQLLVAPLGKRNVTAVDIREITLAPGQAAGRHLHPCAVVGYVVEGAAIYEIEGAPAHFLQAGAAFYEPANVVIAEFGNASATDPMKFIAFYLLDGEQELITMLESRRSLWPSPRSTHDLLSTIAQGKNMPREIHWTDAEEIGIQLQEKYPEIDPLTVRFTDLHRYVTELDGFADDPAKSNEPRLEAIQMAWHEEYEDAKG